MWYCNSCGLHRTPFGCAEIKEKISTPYIHAALLLFLVLNSFYLAALFNIQGFVFIGGNSRPGHGHKTQTSTSEMTPLGMSTKLKPVAL